MKVLRTLTRYYVTDFDAAAAVLEGFYGPRLLEYPHATHDLRVAVIGDALLIAGEPGELDKVRGASAALVVSNLDAAHAIGGTSRGTIIVDGRRQATVDYLDGLTLELIELPA